MKIKITLLAVFSLALSLPQFGQNQKGLAQINTDEIPSYYSDGVKMSKVNNTPLLITNINDVVKGDTPVEMAFDWISNHQQLLKIDNLADLKVRFKRSSLSGHTIRFQQNLNTIPIYHSEIAIHISTNNKVTYVDNTYDPSVKKISTSPNIEKEVAFQLAKTAINAKGKVSFSDNQLYIYNRLEKTKLIYKVLIEPESPLGSWEVLVDAQNGEILRAVDKAYYVKESNQKTMVNGTGNVFDPDPLSYANATYAGNYVDNGDATNAQLDAATISVTLLDIDLTAGTYSLKGPYAEVQDFEAPNKGLFTQSTSNFNFNRFDDAFEAVNCYYIIDKSMRYINQTLGIPLMPYQYTTGVRYDPSGLNGVDNSHYMGGSGKLAFGEGGVDDAEDADVVIHELGHGLHDWLTGGSASQVNGLGEGSGDYWGQSYSRSLGQWTSSDPEYQWFFSWDGHNEFWSGRVTNYTATYPGGLTGAIHTDGQIWATTLMRIYDILGREKVDKAFLEGLAMTGSSTNQQDAAIAVRQAAIDMGYSCADVDIFTQEFTATGYNMPPLNHVIVSLGPDLMICSTDTISLNAGTYNNYLWQDNSTNPTFFIDGNSTGIGNFTYWVDVTEPSGCTNVDSINVNVAICTAISTKKGINDTISVYPVPTHGIVSINMNVFVPNTKIQLLDNLGRTVVSFVAKNKLETIDISNFSNGVYSLIINTDSEIVVKKIIKE